MFTVSFWKHATERALKTFAQFVLSLQAGDAFNLLSIDWPQTLGVALGGVVLSYATSIVSAGVKKDDSPDLVTDK
jgi:hypothetical protein